MAKDPIKGPICPDIDTTERTKRGRIRTFPFIEAGKKLTRPSSLKPERKETERDAKSSRIVVVCPYTQFSDYFESIATDIVKGAGVDKVYRAEQSKPPYINVSLREQGFPGPEPLFIIDFQRIIAPVMKEVYDESEMISLRGTAFAAVLQDYLDSLGLGTEEIPEELLKKELRDRELFDHIRSRLLGRIKEELEKAVDQAMKPKEVDEVIGFSGYQLWSRARPIGYIYPNNEFASILERNHRYDDGLNFIPDSVSVNPYRRKIRADLRKYVELRAKDIVFLKLELFEIRELIH